MYSNILVPLVLDHVEEKALAVAKKLANATGKITLLNVIEAIPGNVATYLPEGTLERNATEALDSLKDIAERTGSNCSAHVVWGHSSRTILDYAEEHGADCIVISSHKPGLEDYFLGSTAARVVRHAPCCVHILR